MEIAVEKIAALFYLVIGLSLLLRTTFWMKYVERFKTGVLSGYEFIHLLVGITIIVLHNIWVMGPAVIITIIGWVATFKIVLYLLFPDFLIGQYPKEENLSKALKIEGAVITLATLIVLFTLPIF